MDRKRNQTTVVGLDRELLHQARIQAAIQQRTLGAVINEAIKQWLERQAHLTHI